MLVSVVPRFLWSCWSEAIAVASPERHCRKAYSWHSLCSASQDHATAEAKLMEAETQLERIHRDVVEVQTKKTLAANSQLVTAASAVLEEHQHNAKAKEEKLEVRCVHTQHAVDNG